MVVPRWGVEYEIRIRNNESLERVLFVIGVDGLSVMDGSHASQNSGGYVLDARRNRPDSGMAPGP